MSDVVVIKIHVGTGFAGCSHNDTFEISRDEWDQMSEKDREDMLDELAVDFRNNVIECSAWVVE